MTQNPQEKKPMSYIAYDGRAYNGEPPQGWRQGANGWWWPPADHEYQYARSQQYPESSYEPADVGDRSALLFGMTNLELGALAGQVLVVLGSLLPWARLVTVFGSVSLSGTSGDGQITLVLGLIGGACVIAAVNGHNGHVFGVIVAAIAAAIAMYTIVNVSDLADEGAARAEVGIGLWLVLIGAAVAAFAGLKARSVHG